MPDFDDEVLEAAISSCLKHDEKMLGLLLFGSAARDAMLSASDVDLICILDVPRERSISRKLGNLELDVFFIGRNQILRAIEIDIKSNNNYVLAAFTEGRIVSDPYQLVSHFKQRASEIWASGPREITSEEVPGIRMWLTRNSRSILMLNAKTQRSTCSPAIAETQCAVYFSHMVYAYCRVRKLWASSLFILMTLEDTRYNEIQHLCRLYLAGASLEARTDAVVLLARTIKGHLDK